MSMPHDDLGTSGVDDAAVLRAAATEHRDAPATAVEAADATDRYDQMLRLADLFDAAGEQMREWAKLGGAILSDPGVSDSAALSPGTWAEAEDEVRAATSGRHGLLSRSIELDADALVLRATVLTYRWIDDLRVAAQQTLGSIAGKAIGYLAPEVALGGAIVSAGLIETDAVDRDGVAAYLNELAEANPELMDHVTTGGGLVDSLQMRALLTAGVFSDEAGRHARGGGLRAAGVAELSGAFGAALRDAGVALTDAGADEKHAEPAVAEAGPPAGLGDLVAGLAATTEPLRVQSLSDSHHIVYLPGPAGAPTGPGQLRLVSGDLSSYVDDVARALGGLAGSGVDAHVMLVGGGTGGAAAVALAAREDLPGFVVDQVVTVSSPSAQVPRLPRTVRVLSLEDRSDPVALFGSLVNAGSPNRVSVVFDAHALGADGAGPYVAGGLAADRSDDPALRAELERLRELGYLAR
ncbi:MAG TPA: hypothetical protein VNS55_05655 [Nocardioides sp.]|nr:hypothetical protein [Nocardioides sp.]